MSKAIRFVAALTALAQPATAWAFAPEVIPTVGDYGLMALGAVIAIAGLVHLARRGRSRLRR